MNEPIGTFIIDFQTISFEQDAKIANNFISEMQKTCELENQYALDSPLERAGWAFAKLFFAGQFVERIYANNSYEIDRTKGKKFEEKFIRWLSLQLKNKGCGALIKAAPEMKQY